jgi:hypothetical protein
VLRRPSLLCFLIAVALAGCGSSQAPANPTPTLPPVSTGSYADPATGITVSVRTVMAKRDHALLLLTMANHSKKLFTAPGGISFADSAVGEPGSHPVASGCSADETNGPGLDFGSVPAGVTNRGWIRCEYPAGSSIFIIAWMGHALSSYRIPH